MQFEMLTVSPGAKEVMESAKCLILEVHECIVQASRVTSMWNTRLGSCPNVLGWMEVTSLSSHVHLGQELDLSDIVSSAINGGIHT